ncbi:hypothetical protein MKX03_016720 [Papaver bracteatum]|nr:hypothetical protein MKX03_016720 [Papaver bracteatum]
MGQKINPLGFRLGATQKHHSLWFSQPKSYSEGLQEDQKIRDCIKNYGIVRIEIKKRIDLVQVIIYMRFPKWLIEGKPRGIVELHINVQKGYNYVNRKLKIAITRIAKPYGDPNILAEFIARQLKNRVSFRKAMKKAIDGKEITCVEWIREGRFPLQIIRAKIDYCSYTIQTIYGVLGIRIWIFADEK